MLLSLQRERRRSTSTPSARAAEASSSGSSASTTCRAPDTRPSSSWSRSTRATRGCSARAGRASCASSPRRRAASAPAGCATWPSSPSTACSASSPGPRSRRPRGWSRRSSSRSAASAVPYPPGVIEQANEADAERRAALERAQSGARGRADHARSCARRSSAPTPPAASSAGAGTPTPTPTCAASTSRALARARPSGCWRGTADAYAGALAPRLAEARPAAAGRAAARRPAAVLPRPGARRRLRRLDGSSRRSPRRWPGSGSTSRAQPNVHLDTESRPTKSPRAFCSPLRVPDEVHLVVAPVGGREDFGAMMHEGGHPSTTRTSPPSCRSSTATSATTAVTESFAFLFERLDRGPGLARATCSGSSRPSRCVAHARASWLLLLRRYCAKLAYERELHGRRARPRRDAGPLRRAARRRHPGRRGRGEPGSPTSTRASTSSVTCAPGRWRPTGAGRCASASASAGSPSPRPASGCSGCGATASGCRPRSCSARRSARSSTSARWSPS